MRLRYPFARFFSMVVLGAVALCAQAPVAAPTSPTAVAPLRFGIATPPRTLNPLLAADATGARVLQLTHPALLQWDEVFNPVGLVAERCTQPSPTQLVCHLPAGRHFTSGAPLTAPALASWLQQLQQTPRSPLAGAWRDVSISAPAPQQLVLTLPAPTLGFWATLVETPLADPAALQHGLGPYVAQTESVTQVITLYPQPGQRLPALQLIPLADATTRVLQLQQHALDGLVHDLPPTLVGYVRQQAARRGWEVLSIPSSSYTYVALNFRHPLLAEPTVRQALSLALNRPLLRRALLVDAARPANSLLPLGHPALWAAPEDPYDRFTAEALLDETLLPDGRTLLLGPEGTRLTLTLLTSTDAFAQRLGQALQAAWAQVGVDVELQSAEWASFHSRVQQGQFDAALLTWTGLQDPTFYAKLFHSQARPPQGFNRGAVQDATLDALLDDLLQAPTLSRQFALAQPVQQRVAALRPYLPLWRRDHLLVLGPTVRGCTMGQAGDFRGLMTCVRVAP